MWPNRDMIAVHWLSESRTDIAHLQKHLATNDEIDETSHFTNERAPCKAVGSIKNPGGLSDRDGETRKSPMAS